MIRQNLVSRARRAQAALVLGVGTALLAGVLFPLHDEFQAGVARSAEDAARPVSLDVALVNEDRGVTAGEDDLNLGRGFVTQVEADRTTRWRVVSRGVAERGLVTGAYHLMVIIPSDFSAKLLDLDSPDPEPIAITYQVNGNGNVRAEATADRRGQEIVGRLNAQLVDVYLASILGNLRQAQDNVRRVVDAQAASTATFAADVEPGAREIGLGVETVDGLADGAAAVTALLHDGLGLLTEDLGLGVEETTAHDDALVDLLAAREEGAVTHGVFLESLLALDARLLGEEVAAVLDGLVATSRDLDAQLVDRPGTENHAAAVTALLGLTAEQDEAVRGRLDALRELDDAAVLATYGARARALVAADGGSSVLLADVLRVAGRQGDDVDREIPALPLLRAAAERRVSVLPYRHPRELRDAIGAGLFDHAGGTVSAAVGSMAEDLRVVRAWSGHGQVPPDPDAVVGADLPDLVGALESALGPGTAEPDEGTGEPGEPEPEVRSSGTDEGAEGSEPQEPGTDEGPAADPAAVAVAAAAYAGRVTEMAAAYRSAAEAVRALEACPTDCGLPADASVGSVLDLVVAFAVAQQVADEVGYLRGSSDLVARAVEGVADLVSTLEGLRVTGADLTATVAEQLETVASLRTDVRDLRGEEREVARSVAATDAMARDAQREARALAVASERLLAAAGAEAEVAEDVGDLISGVRADLASLETMAGDLDARGVGLSADLTERLTGAEEFADSFDGVLPHAHSAGVLNEHLLGFLVDPVRASPRDSVATADVMRPFPWVLIAAAVCGLAGHLLARWRTRAVASRGGVRGRATALAAPVLSGVVIGLATAWASGAALAVPRESQAEWALALVLACVTLTALARWLARECGGLGTGMCALALVGYVLVSDAVGTGVGGGVSAAVAAANPLCAVESVLSASLASGTAAVGLAVLAPLVWWALGASVLTLVERDDARRLVARLRPAVPA